MAIKIYWGQTWILLCGAIEVLTPERPHRKPKPHLHPHLCHLLAVELIIGTRAGFVISLLFLGWLSFAELSPFPPFCQIVKVFSALYFSGRGLTTLPLLLAFMDALYLVNDFDVDNFNRKQSGEGSLRWGVRTRFA